MYSLYYNKKEGIIKIGKTHTALKRVEHKEEVTRYNDCYYLCLKKNPLIEFASQMRDEWIKEYESKIDYLKSLKF